MEATVELCQAAQAKKVYTAVLVDKQIDRVRHFAKADFSGLVVPNRYVFGYGMDYKGYLRNLPGLYGLSD